MSCFLLSLFSILIAYFNPAHGYELSLYDFTPPIVWISLILSIFGAISITVYILYRNLLKYYYFCFLGIFILLFDRIILLYIPYIRGYYSWSGDNITHIGILKDILTFGHTPSNIIYPITHILLSELVYITGLPIKTIANHTTALFSAFYVVSIYLLATSSLVTKREQIFAVTSIACVFFNSYDIYIMPNGWSLLYLPVILFFYFKSLTKNHSLEYTILFFITLIMYPFFHPLSTVVLILILVIIGLVEYLISIFKNKNFLLVKKSSFPLTPILLEIVIFLPWLLSFKQFNLNIKIMYRSIMTGSSPDVIASMSGTINKLSLTTLEFIELSIRLLGQQLIFLIFFLLSVILLMKYPNNKKNTKYLTILLSITSFIGLMYASYLLNIIPGLQAIEAARLQAYLVIFTPIFAGFVLSYIVNKEITIHKLNLAPTICVIIILIASTLSIFNVYPSPHVMQPNPSITQMNMNCVEWFLNFRNPVINNVYIMSPVYRFAAAVLGASESEKILGPNYLETNIPNHFSYTTVSNFGKSYIKDKFCMITIFDKTVYNSVWKVVGRFNKDDFGKLENDFSVDKLYSNGENDDFYVHSFS